MSAKWLQRVPDGCRGVPNGCRGLPNLQQGAKSPQNNAKWLQQGANSLQKRANRYGGVPNRSEEGQSCKQSPQNARVKGLVPTCMAMCCAV